MHLNGSQISANIHITTEDKVVRRCTNKEKIYLIDDVRRHGSISLAQCSLLGS